MSRLSILTVASALGLSFAVSSVTLLAQPAADSSYSITLSAGRWKSRPDLVTGREPNPGAVQPEGTALRFASEGPVSHPRSSKWTYRMEGEDLSQFAYVVLEYKAQWLEEEPREVLTVMTGDAPTKLVPLAIATDLITDGRWHKLIARRELPRSPSELLLTLDSQDSRCYLTVRSLRFVASPAGFGVALQHEPGTTEVGFRTIDLQKQFDASYDHLLSSLLERPHDSIVNDSGAYFRSQAVTISGVPFQVGTAGNNLVSPPPPPAANDDIIENFGVKVKRSKVAPISRDSLTEISVGVPASEVFMLIAAEFPSKRQHSGGATCMSVEDVEWFAVELQYEDGTDDFAFPYSIQDGRHVIQRMLGAYVVPASSGTLKRVILHNRMLAGNIHLAALTVNTGKRRLFPQLIEQPQQAAQVSVEPPVRTPYAKRKGSVLALGNSYIDLAIDTSNAFAITSLKNHWLETAAMALRPSPGLEVAANGKQLLPTDFKISAIRAIPNGFEVTYRSRLAEVPLDLVASVSVESNPEARFLLTAVNKSAGPLDVNIRFPRVSGLRIGANADLWYMFPKYRNALSNLQGTYYNGAGCPFPMQFYDIFNPRLGGGVFVMTKELNNRAQRYYLSKTDVGASFYIEHPQLYTHLKGGERYQYTETVIGVHPGDWHAGLKRYKEWLATWYRPYKSQQDSKAWYRELFWLICEYADDVDRDAVRLPVWYDAVTKHYRMRDILKEFEQSAGGRPDLLHFWGWTWRPYRWGFYGEPNYKDLGGLENFRAALDDIRQNLQMPISLYIDAELCSVGTDFCDGIGPALGMRGADGKVLHPYRSYRMCHYTQKWQDYMKSVYPRVYRETGTKILYVDELASPGFECYGRDHGHAVPLNMNEADYSFLKAIREATPEEVALYGEYPATDVASQYWDCNISYYNVGYGERLGQTYDQRPAAADDFSPACLDLYRFVFPRVVQLVLPQNIKGSSWHALKFIFFNGQAHYDSFWDRFESKGQQFMNKAFRIKKAFSDCFTSDAPEMLVPTEMRGVMANKWPGKGRTVWTLYNQRYGTVRGRIFAVDHTEGASYYDVWNDRPLKPAVENGKAYLSVEMDPQGVGCVVQILR